MEVTLRTFQNQVAASGRTDDQGWADFSDIDEDVFFIEAAKDGQRSFVKPAEMSWNLSTFDTEGVRLPEGIGEREGDLPQIDLTRGLMFSIVSQPALHKNPGVLPTPYRAPWHSR